MSYLLYLCSNEKKRLKPYLKDAEIEHLNEYIDSLMVKIITRAPDILQSSTPL